MDRASSVAYRNDDAGILDVNARRQPGSSGPACDKMFVGVCAERSLGGEAETRATKYLEAHADCKVVCVMRACPVYTATSVTEASQQRNDAQDDLTFTRRRDGGYRLS